MIIPPYRFGSLRHVPGLLLGRWLLRLLCVAVLVLLLLSVALAHLGGLGGAAIVAAVHLVRVGQLVRRDWEQKGKDERLKFILNYCVLDIELH